MDYWRFYRDSCNALVTWGRSNGTKPLLLESYTSLQHTDQWNDFVAVFLKDEHFAQRYPKRIRHNKRDFNNGIVFDEPDRFLNYSMLTQDRTRLQTIRQALPQALS